LAIITYEDAVAGNKPVRVGIDCVDPVTNAVIEPATGSFENFLPPIDCPETFFCQQSIALRANNH
jgi:hypothetical protein